MRAWTDTFIHPGFCACTQLFSFTQICMHACTQKGRNRRAYTQMSIHANKCIYTNKYSYTDKNMHTQTRAHAHARIMCLVWVVNWIHDNHSNSNLIKYWIAIPDTGCAMTSIYLLLFINKHLFYYQNSIYEIESLFSCCLIYQK